MQVTKLSFSSVFEWTRSPSFSCDHFSARYWIESYTKCKETFLLGCLSCIRLWYTDECPLPRIRSNGPLLLYQVQTGTILQLGRCQPGTDRKTWRVNVSLKLYKALKCLCTWHYVFKSILQWKWIFMVTVSLDAGLQKSSRASLSSWQMRPKMEKLS